MEDAYSLTSAVQALRSFKGWAIDGCQDIGTPFASTFLSNIQLPTSMSLYIAIVMNKGAHFIVDQLSIVLQLRELSHIDKIYVSVVEYGKNEDGGSFLLDLVEGCLAMADISYTIEQLQSRYSSQDTYYPQLEADLRNLALAPLLKMKSKRIRYDRVIWLRGFICPGDLFAMVKTSYHNNASMVCGMDWRVEGSEQRLVFTDVWRTRDIQGRAFRKVDSKGAVDIATGPVREEISAKRFQDRLPFQVFCCEGGSHVVDPATTYYQGLTYTVEDPDIKKDAGDNSPCMDSAQMHFCRDIWLRTAKNGLEDNVRQEYQKEQNKLNISPAKYRALMKELTLDKEKLREIIDPARIMIHPGCLTTYVDGSHAQLVTDFTESAQERPEAESLDDESILLRPAPDAYLCQEMRSRGGRQMPKTQRWMPYHLVDALQQWAKEL